MNLREGLGAVRWGMRPDEVLAAVPGSEKSAGFMGRNPKTGETWTEPPGVASEPFTPAPDGVTLRAHFRFEQEAMVEISLSPELPDEPPPGPPIPHEQDFLQRLLLAIPRAGMTPEMVAWRRRHLIEPAHRIAQWLGGSPRPDTDQYRWPTDDVALELEVTANDASVSLRRPGY